MSQPHASSPKPEQEDPERGGPYILDFAAAGARLAVEVDGESHFQGDGPARDAERDAWLEGQGWRVLRFTNPEVMGNLEGVLEIMRAALRGFPHPGPLPEGEGDA